MPLSDAADALQRRWLAQSGNMRGALWLLGSVAGFSVMNGLIKARGAEMHPFEVAFFRCLFGFLAVVPFALRNGVEGLRTSRPLVHVFRICLGVGAMLCVFYSLTNLPLAVATAFFFTKPLFMIVLAVLFLGERVRWRRWLATAIGFVGVMVMLGPDAGAGFGAAAWIAMLATLLMAAVLVVVKRLTATEQPMTMMFWFSGGATLGCLPAALAVWRAPTPGELMVLLLVGVLGSLAQWLAVRAYRVGEATVVTPMEYLQLLFAGAIGYFAFAELPTLHTVAGAVVIAASTLYIIERERALHRAQSGEGADRGQPAGPGAD